MDLKQKVASAIKAARVENGLTMQQLADKLNVAGTATISKYESGKYNISADLIDKICAVLDIEPKIIFEKTRAKI